MLYFIICVVASGCFGALITYVDDKNSIKPETSAFLTGAAVSSIVGALIAFVLGALELAGIHVA